MAVLVKNYKHGSLTLDLYVKIDRVAGGKKEGWGALLSSYPSKADSDEGQGVLRQFNLDQNAPYTENEHPFKSVYDFYKLGMTQLGYIVEDV